MGRYLSPKTMDEAMSALGGTLGGDGGGGLTVLAGGTDYYPARVGRPLDDDILDITGIETLRGITDDGDSYRIGATTTWTDLVDADLPTLFDGLKRAAREVGGVQIQNAGTIAGNLCNASPAADGVPPLLAMDARVELISPAGTTVVPLDQFILGNRTTALKPGQMVGAVLVPKPGPRTTSHFIKLGARRYLVISIIMAAAVVEADDAGAVAAARVAVGACSAVAQRLPDLEARLAGQPLDGALGGTVSPSDVAHLTPIDDIRASAAYRADAVVPVVRRLLNELGAGA